MPVGVIQIDNTYKQFKAAMRSVGFREGQLKEEQHIEKEVLQQEQVIQNKRFQTTKNRVHRWERKLKKILSDPLPAKLKHKRRPALRKFPYMNSGAMRDSVEVDLEMTRKRASWVYTLTAHVDGLDNTSETDHATLTNAGANSSARNVRWRGWVDNVFGVTAHSAKIVSAGELMRKQLFQSVAR